MNEAKKIKYVLFTFLFTVTVHDARLCCCLTPEFSMAGVCISFCSADRVCSLVASWHGPPTHQSLCSRIVLPLIFWSATACLRQNTNWTQHPITFLSSALHLSFDYAVAFEVSTTNLWMAMKLERWQKYSNVNFLYFSYGKLNKWNFFWPVIFLCYELARD